MSIVDTRIIDSVILDDEDKSAVLLITDHLDWQSPKGHLLSLQQKLNTYIEFVESKQIQNEFPKVVGRDISIVVACQYDLIEPAVVFYEQAAKFLLEKANIELLYVFEQC